MRKELMNYETLLKVTKDIVMTKDPEKHAARHDSYEYGLRVFPVEDEQHDEKHEAPGIQMKRAFEHHCEEDEGDLQGCGPVCGALEHLEEEKEEEIQQNR